MESALGRRGFHWEGWLGAGPLKNLLAWRGLPVQVSGSRAVQTVPGDELESHGHRDGLHSHERDEDDQLHDAGQEGAGPAKEHADDVAGGGAEGEGVRRADDERARPG